MSEQEKDDLIALIGWQAPSSIRVCTAFPLPGGVWAVTIYDAAYDLNVVLNVPDEWHAYLHERAAHPDRATLLAGGEA